MRIIGPDLPTTWTVQGMSTLVRGLHILATVRSTLCPALEGKSKHLKNIYIGIPPKSDDDDNSGE